MRQTILSLIISFFILASCRSQQTKTAFPDTQDSLRGSVTPERAWWDVLKYDIYVEPDVAHKTIRGNIAITLKTTAQGQRMQIDLQQPMTITTVTSSGRPLKFERAGNVYYALFEQPVGQGTILTVHIEFGGTPREAVSPPWDGGWIWKTDSYGNPWISVACQGLGASSWYPCKDYQGDEPDSASLTITVPQELTAVGNGRLREVKRKDGKAAYTWAVVSPINNYNIVPYIGKYVNWSEKYQGEKGLLDINYWVLEENADKAKKQFQQVPEMLACFEHWFGPYPFYEDGYKLVEAPHLGMEHQSAVAYGNQFRNGYLGNDLSGTGWGTKWDFIIVHESAHEWFANSITTEDIADMWVHEAFANFSEILFTTCQYGTAAGNEYCIGLRSKILNDIPVIGKYGVNKEGSNDMYYKGSNLVQMIRQIIDDDEKFRTMLRKMNRDFYHKTVTSKIIETFISTYINRDLSKVFDQYLRTVQIPVLEYRINAGKLSFRWSGCVKGFNMPVRIFADEPLWLNPSEKWQTIDLRSAAISVDPNFYISSRKM